MPRTLFKELTVQEWFEEIDRGLDYRATYGLERHWAELERMFYHVHESQLVAGPNIIASTGDALLSHLTVPRPRFIVNPLRQDKVLGARVVQSVDNMLVRTMKLRTSVQRAVLAAYIWGVGFLKVGYDSEFGYAPEYDLGGKHLPLGLTVTQMDRKGRAIEFGTARAGMPWVDDEVPHNIVLPWGVKDLDHAPWYAHRFIRHIDDIRADVKYEKTGNLNPVMSMEDFVESHETGVKAYRNGRLEVHSGGVDGPSSDAEYCECFEIHDRRTGRVIVIATGYDEFLRYEDDLLQVNGGLPLVAIRFVPHARNFWVTPDAYYLKAAQAELTDISLQAAKQRRAGNLRFAIREDALDAREATKAMTGDVGVCFKVKGATPLNEAIASFQPGNNQQLYAEKQVARQDAGEIVGMPRNQLGEFDGSSRRTAREVMEVKGAANLRMSRRQTEMADVFTEAIRKVNGIIFENWTAPRVAQILDLQGQQAWQQFTGPSIAAEYAYEVAFTTEGTPTVEERRQQAMQEYSILSQDPRIDPIAIAQYLAGKYGDVDFTSNFKQGVVSGTAGIQMGAGPAGSAAPGVGQVAGGGPAKPGTPGQ